MDLVIAPLTSTPRQGRGLIKGKITKRSQELSCLQQMVVGQLTITDCSTASRGAALPDTIRSNGVPANLRWTSRAGDLNVRRLVPVAELPNEANKTFVFNDTLE